MSARVGLLGPMWIHLVIILCLYETTESSDPLDITFYSSTPLVSNSVSFLGHALKSSRTTDITIGILYQDMDGKGNVTWSDTGHSGDITYRTGEGSKDMPDDKIFDTESKVAYRVHNDFVKLGVTNLPDIERVGVFSFEATKDGVVSKSAIVLTSSSFNIRMQFRTLTVGIGESVTINLSEGNTNLRWSHNYGDAIEMWNGASTVTIENIRAKDDGVYECYTGDSPDGNHGIMRLIVRDCPLPKWNPPECETDCPVCYNGGVCDDKTGLCICPAGFSGSNCETACGSNNWGRNCDVVCASGSGNACRGKLFCPPDPFGCTCIDGYGGNDCNTACDNSHYGADCRQSCHCDNCNRKTGCGSGSCWNGYTGPACQEIMPNLPCPSGLFGVLCNFQCHCKNSADCNRDGSCDTGCHEAWAGPNCSIALPYRSRPPTIVNQTATTVTFNASWVPGQDFGTGTIRKWKLLYKIKQTNPFTSVSQTDNDVFTIDNLLPHTTVEFYTQHSRLVDDEETNGPPSEHGSVETICTKPLEEPEIKLKTVEGNEIILKLEPVSNAPEQIQCDDILRYQVRYLNIDRNEQDIVNTTDGSQTEVTISGLSECVAYDVDSRVINNEEIVGDWGKSLRVQTAPSAPSINKDSILEETFLLMKWNAATCNAQDDQLTYHYQLSDGIVKQGSTTETEVLLNDGIKPCTKYTFTVLASHLNINGTTDNEEVTSAVDYPGKPSIISFTATSSSVILEWTASDDNTCLIQGYNVLVVSSDLKEFNMNTTDTSLTITEDIMPNTIYSAKVAARTLKGYGDFSDFGYVYTNSGCKFTGYIVAGTLSIASLLISTSYLILLNRKLKKKIHTISKESKVNMDYVNVNTVTRHTDEAAYETPIPTEQQSYETLTHKHESAYDNTAIETSHDKTYEQIAPP